MLTEKEEMSAFCSFLKSLNYIAIYDGISDRCIGIVKNFKYCTKQTWADIPNPMLRPLTTEYARSAYNFIVKLFKHTKSKDATI